MGALSSNAQHISLKHIFQLEISVISYAMRYEILNLPNIGYFVKGL